MGGSEDIRNIDGKKLSVQIDVCYAALLIQDKAIDRA
jgi:hypothetical protein